VVVRRPFSVEDKIILLRQYFCNPWAESSFFLGLMSLALGGFFFWFSRRINDAKIFSWLAYLLGFHAVFFAIFFHTRFPHPLVVLLEAVQVAAIFIIFAALLAALIITRLVELGVDDRYLYYHDNSNIKLEITGGITVLFLMAAWFIFGGEGPFLFLLQGLGGRQSEWVLIFVLILLVPLAALASREILPWKGEQEAALLGEDAPARELENIFAMTGAAGKTEVFLASLVIVAVYAFFALLSHQKREPTDWFGLLVLIGVIYSIFRRETTKGKKKEEIPEELRRRKSHWTSTQ
jgi:hypothetical protein